MADQKVQVLDAMKKKGKPVRPGDIAKDLGIESKEVSKVIKELKKKVRFNLPRIAFGSQSKIELTTRMTGSNGIKER